jgi:hypothetical protein
MFPRLAMMAKDYYSTQRKSSHGTMVAWMLTPRFSLNSAAERLFSAAGNAQERHQAHMAPETLQALITLRAWWKPGVLGFDSVVA